MKFGERTWPDAAAQRHKVVVVPIGSLEQHGHHLPLLTDSLIGSEITRRAEGELGDDVLFLPMLWIGASHHHLHFPGTVSLSQDVYIKVLEDLVESLLAGGYRRILLLNSHAGNVTPAQAALTNVQIRRRKEMPDLYLALASWFDLARDAVAAVPGLRQGTVSHACEWETSVVEAVRPELVQKSAACGARFDFDSRYFDPDYSGPSRLFVARTMEQGTTTGAYGWPEEASAEKGKRILDAAVSEVVAFVREFAGWLTIEPHPRPEG